MSIIPKSYEVLAIVQARVSSSRLPQKVLKKVLDKPLILHELERLDRSEMINQVVLATSSDMSDDALAVIVSPMFYVYRGDLNDVLERYYKCAKKYNPKHIVRITGDCPVIDWRLTDEVIRLHLREKNDYTSLSDWFPDGLDTEVFTFSALEKTYKEAKLPSEREHVTQYMRKNSEIFKIGRYKSDVDLSSMRWTVDEPQDLEFISKVFDALYLKNSDFDMSDILKLLKEQPNLLNINAGIIRNEGLLKSLKEDETWIRGESK